jgi:hypothetical protein
MKAFWTCLHGGIIMTTEAEELQSATESTIEFNYPKEPKRARLVGLPIYVY